MTAESEHAAKCIALAGMQLQRRCKVGIPGFKERIQWEAIHDDLLRLGGILAEEEIDAIEYSWHVCTGPLAILTRDQWERIVGERQRQYREPHRTRPATKRQLVEQEVAGFREIYRAALDVFGEDHEHTKQIRETLDEKEERLVSLSLGSDTPTGQFPLERDREKLPAISVDDAPPDLGKEKVRRVVTRA